MYRPLCRKASVALESGAKSFRVNEKNLQDYLGVPKYTDDLIPGENQVGVVNGLAWTSVGGLPCCPLKCLPSGHRQGADHR